MMRSSFIGRSTAIAAASVLALAFGCSSADDKLAGPGAIHGGGTTTTTGTTSTSTSTGAGGGDVGPCGAPGYGGGEKAQMVETADADVVDGEGAPLLDYFVTLCSLDLCINGVTDGTGHARIEHFGKMKKPAFKLGDGAVHVKMAVPAGPSPVIALAGPIWLPALPSKGAPLAAGQTATSGDVSVTLAKDATLEFELEHYPTHAMQELRAVALPVDKSAALIDGEGLEIVYGVGPTNTKICPPATVSVPNSLGWDAGQEVDFFLHGVNVEQDFAPYAGWARIAGGKVSADGKAIETLAGEGFPVLGVIGLKRR